MVKAAYLFCLFSLTLIVETLFVDVFALTKDNNTRFPPISWFQKLGREVSRILLLSYPLEISVALVCSVFNCIGLVSVHLLSDKSRDVDF